MRKGKEMKKKNIIIAAVFAILFTLANTTPVHAQGGIFIMDEEEENFRGSTTPPAGGFIFIDDPEHDTTWDYSPIGSGVWLLGSLAVTYLLGKQRRKTEKREKTGKHDRCLA